MGILADLREFVKESDNKTFFMAVMIVVSFIIIFAITLFYIRDDETLKTVSAIWGTWVGAVIGYFFGARQVDELIKRIDGITKLAEQRVNDLNDSKVKYDNAKSKIDEVRISGERMVNELNELMDLLDKARGDISIIVEKHGAGLPADLVERLKKDYEL